MSIFPFKKLQTESSAVGPALSALQSHRRKIKALENKRQSVIEKEAAARRDCEVAAAAAARVSHLSTAIDQVLADSRYNEVEVPDLTDQRRALADAARDHETRAATARAAESARHRYAGDIGTFNSELKLLYEQTRHFKRAAQLEGLASLAPRFRAAEDALIAIHFEVFACVALLDQDSMANGLGEFYGWGAFGDLLISRPRHGTFQHGPTDPWEAKLAHDAQWRALDVAAAKLNDSLLNGEPEA
jgi:hypothetical protein